MTRAHLRARVKAWQKRLLLSEWKITVDLGPLEHNERADCDARPEYREAHLRFDHTKISEDELDAFVIHELLHVITWRLEALAEAWGRSESQYQVARETAETVVTDLERIILKLATK